MVYKPEAFGFFRADHITGHKQLHGLALANELRKALSEIAALGDATVDIDPFVAGHVTIRLNQVRWDQAFDIIVRVNGLDWTQDGPSLKVFPKGQ